jgi:hypothetical protein
MGLVGWLVSYQPRTDLIKDERGDLPADSHSFLNRCKNYFAKLLNVHRFDVTEVSSIQLHYIMVYQIFLLFKG